MSVLAVDLSRLIADVIDQFQLPSTVCPDPGFPLHDRGLDFWRRPSISRKREISWNTSAAATSPSGETNSVRMVNFTVMGGTMPLKNPCEHFAACLSGRRAFRPAGWSETSRGGSQETRQDRDARWFWRVRLYRRSSAVRAPRSIDSRCQLQGTGAEGRHAYEVLNCSVCDKSSYSTGLSKTGWLCRSTRPMHTPRGVSWIPVRGDGPSPSGAQSA